MTTVTFHVPASISPQTHAGVLIAECGGKWFSVNGHTVRALPVQPRTNGPATLRFPSLFSEIERRIAAVVEV